MRKKRRKRKKKEKKRKKKKGKKEEKNKIKKIKKTWNGERREEMKKEEEGGQRTEAIGECSGVDQVWSRLGGKGEDRDLKVVL